MKSNDNKERGPLNLPEDMPLRDKQVAAAKHTHNQRKAITLAALLQAATALKAKGTPLTQQAVAIRAGLSMSSAKNHWKEISEHFKLYKQPAPPVAPPRVFTPPPSFPAVQYTPKETMVKKLLEMTIKPYVFDETGQSSQAIQQFSELNSEGDFFLWEDLVKIFPNYLAKSLFTDPLLLLPNMHGKQRKPHKVFYIDEVVDAATAHRTKINLEGTCPPHVAQRIQAGIWQNLQQH